MEENKPPLTLPKRFCARLSQAHPNERRRPTSKTPPTFSLPESSVQPFGAEISEHLEALTRQIAGLHNQVLNVGEAFSETRQLLDHSQKKAKRQRQDQRAELQVVQEKLETIKEAMTELDPILSREFGRLGEEVHQMGRLFDQQNNALHDVLTDMAETLHQLRASHPSTPADKERQDLKAKIHAQVNACSIYHLPR